MRLRHVGHGTPLTAPLHHKAYSVHEQSIEMQFFFSLHQISAPTPTKGTAVEAVSPDVSVPSKAAVSKTKSPVADSNNGSSFFFLLLILAVAAGAYGVWRLGGIEKTRVHVTHLIADLRDRVQGRGGADYSRV